MDKDRRAKGLDGQVMVKHNTIKNKKNNKASERGKNIGKRKKQKKRTDTKNKKP